MVAAKTPESRQRRNARGMTIVKTVEPTVLIPKPPDDLLPQTLEAWDTYWTSDISKLATPTDLPSLRRLFMYYDDWDRTYALFQRNPEVFGSAMQIKISHWARHFKELEPLIARLEDRFGLSPRSRLELGVVFGDAAKSLRDLYSAAVEDGKIPNDLFIIDADDRVS